MLEVRNLAVTLKGTPIVRDVSFTAESGQWLMVIGPNGAGKTTVIRAIAGAVPHGGEVLAEGRPVREMKSRERARLIGVLEQSHYIGYGFTVEEVVRLGAYARRGGFLGRVKTDEKRSAGMMTENGTGNAKAKSGGRSHADDLSIEERIDESLVRTGLEKYRHRVLTTLSGGELQRTFLAQLFVQDPKILLLDEPANHLDLIYQRQVFELVRQWLKETNGTVISVVHDLSLARAYGTQALLLHEGRTVAQGSLETVMAPEHLDAVYGMDVAGWMKEMYEHWT